MERSKTMPEEQTSDEPHINDSFYQLHLKRVQAIVTRILAGFGNSEIEDCISEIFAELITRISGYDPARGSIEAYICVIARSITLNYRKRIIKRQEIPLYDDIAAPQTSQQEDDILLTESLKNALKSLNRQERQLFTLRYIYYRTAPEIAEQCDISLSSAEKKCCRLKAKLQKLLRKNGITL